MVNLNAAFSHDFLEIAIGNRVADIKEHGLKNDAFGEMSSLEIHCHLLRPHSVMCSNHDIATQK